MYSNFTLISSAWPFGTPVKKAGNDCNGRWDLNLKLSLLAALFSPFNLSDNVFHSVPAIGLTQFLRAFVCRFLNLSPVILSFPRFSPYLFQDSGSLKSLMFLVQ